MVHSNKIIIGKANSGKSTLADKMIRDRRLSVDPNHYFQVIQWKDHDRRNNHNSQYSIATIVDRRTTLSSTITGELCRSFTDNLKEFENLEPHTDRTLIIDDYTSILANCNSQEKAIIKKQVEHLILNSASQRKSIWIMVISSIAESINLSTSIVSMCNKYLITDETTSDWFNREWQQLNTNSNILDFMESMEVAYECSKQSKCDKALYNTQNNQWQPL